MTWRERTIQAHQRGHFTDEDKVLAAEWATCSVGEQHEISPLVVVYSRLCQVSDACTAMGPQDLILREFGSYRGFYGAVYHNRVNEAESWLDKIEDRVLQLKRGEK